METQTEHWPSLLNCLITEMTKNIQIMKIDEIHHGILLAMKLLSKVSPSMKSPQPSRRESRTYGKQKSGSNASRDQTDVDTEPASPANELEPSESEESCFDVKTERRVKRFSIMQSCIESSKAFFTRYVSHCLGPWLFGCEVGNSKEKTSLPEDTDSNGDSKLPGDEDSNEDSDHSLKMQSFTSFCRYLVELSCFPSWKSSIGFSVNEATG